MSDYENFHHYDEGYAAGYAAGQKAERERCADVAEKACLSGIGGVTHYGPEPYQICAAYVRAAIMEDKSDEV